MMSRIKCPQCENVLERMWYTEESDGSIVGVFHCESCLGGIDSDWEITCSKDGEIKETKRYYFG